MKFNTQYLAGLFDGEGCIFIQSLGSRGYIMPQYGLWARINMVHRPLIEGLAECFGCSVIVHRKDLKNSKHRAAFEVSFYGNKARDFLVLLYDDLMIKKEEARLAIEFQNHINRYAHKLHQLSGSDLQGIINYREGIRLRVKDLKKMSFIGVTEWNAGEPGGNPMPDLFEIDAEGQYRTKQGLTVPGVRNEQVPASKEKVCSEPNGNIGSAAEMSAPDKLRLVK